LNYFNFGKKMQAAISQRLDALGIAFEKINQSSSARKIQPETAYADACVKSVKSRDSKMKTPHQISSELNQFTGSTTLYKHWLGLKYTDGIKYLAAMH
jgi:hypothetical protein